jgi:hypothetical protein
MSENAVGAKSVPIGFFQSMSNLRGSFLPATMANGWLGRADVDLDQGSGELKAVM